ncbi:MAG: DsbA family protein [Aggregatilineaceae bacterium]
MTKTNKPSHRTSSQRQTRWIVGGLVILVAAAALFAILSNAGEAAPEAVAERLTLDPVLGDPNAPVTVVEYGAYGCSACQAWHRSGTIEQILAEYPGQVRFVYRDFPVVAPSYSRMAARTAQCALDQGNDAFWAYHDALFTLADSRSSQADLIRLGEQVGLDTAALQACVDANTHVATVQYDEDQGHKLGLLGTPAFLVNGQELFFASPSGLREAIERALN